VSVKILDEIISCIKEDAPVSDVRIGPFWTAVPDIVHVAARNDAGARAADFSAIREVIQDAEPDLILGSSYERALADDAAFVGLTPPLRARSSCTPGRWPGSKGRSG